MNKHANRSAYVKSPWQFEVRDNPVSGPGPGQLLIEIAACAVCGTDFHTADRLADDWQAFGHEISGVVRAVGDGVERFKSGDRVGLDSSVPCGRCETCLPAPYGSGQPDLCESGTTYWNATTMGFGKLMVVPEECAVAVPDSVPMDVACLVEPVGVSTDFVNTAQIRPGDDVLIIGPGPLGLAVIYLAKKAGAWRVLLAGLSQSEARLQAGLALGADDVIEVDRSPLSDYDFGARRPNKILVTAPPSVLPEAIKVAALGATIAYIGIAFGPGSVIQFDADDFHFRKLCLRGSFGSPGTYAMQSMRLLADNPELGRELISHRFGLEDIGEMMQMARDDQERTVKKIVMVNPATEGSI